MNTHEIIETLDMRPHPEGGFYKETYRSNQTCISANNAQRNVGTAIYYLLQDDDKSHFHRLSSDELWFFHLGQPLEIVCIVNGKIETLLLSNHFENGDRPQCLIPANTWFAARVMDSKGYGLVSCTVSPGFDFADFEMADRSLLIAEFPHLKKTIEMFTR
jgi:predicted cupin superfamily sugar epimerase